MTAALTGCALQGSLWDVGEEAGLRELGSSVRRTTLSRGAWLDLRPAWATGSDALFTRLVDTVPWHGERRQMYERVVDVPRLLSFYGEDEPLPDPLLGQARTDLSRHDAGELGERVGTAGLGLYRDGRDEVGLGGGTHGPRRAGGRS